MKLLITGSAGFIGMSTSMAFLKQNYTVIGIDNLNSFYDIRLKIDRNNELKKFKKYKFYNFDISKKNKKIKSIIKKHKIKIVLHLAAQANVRYSLKNPRAYIRNNIVGFYNIIEACRELKVEKFIFASSSSVYGKNYKLKNFFIENDKTDTPKNLYAATKKSNEVIAYAYSDLFNINTVGLRFFTVYGPWGRPDMAPFIFLKSILERKTIKIFNSGKMFRDFTYIDDVVNAIVKIAQRRLTNKKNFYKILNIGRGKSENLMKFIKIMESTIDMKSKKKYLPLQMGDMVLTQANIKELKKFIKYTPRTELKVGLKKFCDWYIDYYKYNKKFSS